MKKKLTACMLSFSLVLIPLFGFTACNDPHIDYIMIEGDPELCERFTQDDHLIHSDGSYSLKTVSDFSSALNDRKGDVITELDQIIPKEYLQEEERSVVYHYMGEEYGFLVQHDGAEITLLLLNFSWEKQHVKMYSMRTEVSVSHRFQVRDNGWKCLGQAQISSASWNRLIMENAVVFEKETDSNTYIDNIRVSFDGLQKYRGGNYVDTDHAYISSTMGISRRAYNDKELDKFLSDMFDDRHEEVQARNLAVFSGESLSGTFYNTRNRIEMADLSLVYGGFVQCDIELGGEIQPTVIIHCMTFGNNGVIYNQQIRTVNATD